MHKLTYVSLAILMAMVLLGFLFVSTNSKAVVVNSERFYVDNLASQDTRPSVSVADISNANANTLLASSGGLGIVASDPTGNEVFNPVGGDSAPVPSAACFPRDRLSADDLLPKDAANSRWSQAAAGSTGSIDNVNLLTAGYLVGMNTQGSSLRNANLQLRSEPPNPQLAVGPWQLSTIEPDVQRKPLQIGGDY